MNIVYNNRALKILSVFAFVFFIVVLIFFANLPKANGYEISLYIIIPWYCWLLLTLGIIIGQIVILSAAYRFDRNKNKIWTIGLLIILFGIFILIYMPFIRDYAIYGRGDHLSHLGTIKDIINSGAISSNDFYPIIHIVTSILSAICNINLIFTSMFITRLYPVLFVPGFIIFLRLFFKNHFTFLFSIFFTSSFLFFSSFGNFLSPSLQVFLLVPFLLFLYFKRSVSGKNTPFAIIFIIFSFCLVFYHPLIFLFLLIILIISAIVTFLTKKDKNINILNEIYPEKRKVILPIIIFVIIYLSWYFSFSNIIENFVEGFVSILYGIGDSSISTQISLVSAYKVKLIDLFRIGIFTFGIYLIIGVLSFFSIFYLFYHLYKKKDTQISQYKLFFLSTSILVFIFITALSYIFDFGVNWQRFFLFVTFFSLLIMPIAFFNFSNSKKSCYLLKIFVRNFVLLIIMLILIHSILTFYDSPLVNKINSQVSYGESIGFTWFLSNRNTSYLIEEVGLSQKRFFDAFHHSSTVGSNIRYRVATAPDHFGYNTSKNFGNLYYKNTYLIVTTLGRIVYPTKYPNYEEYWRFTDNDFEMLINDPSVITSYSNSEFSTYLIKKFSYELV